MSDLDYITIEGFKSIRSVERLRLRNINIVIGPNGSGKTNLIDTFAFLHAVRQGNLKNYVLKAGGADNILHFSSKKTEKIRIHIAFSDERNQYQIKLQHGAGDLLIPEFETVYFWDKSYPRPYSEGLFSEGREAAISEAGHGPGVANYVREHLTKWRLYHFHDTSANSPMKQTSKVNDNRFLRSDGENLASFLYLLQNKHPSNYQLIRRSVQRVAPFFKDFSLKPMELNEDSIQLEWIHANSDSYFDASSLSDGTLRFIALATLLLQPAEYRPSMVLIDEPELGLHPYAIAMFAAMLKQAATETQILSATQSSLLLDHFEPEDVLVANQVEGETNFERLDSRDLEQWLDEYSLGQLWEKNEFAGRPNPSLRNA